MVGSSEDSGGGVASVMRIMKLMPFWSKYNCSWLGLQVQGNLYNKLLYALRGYCKAICIIWNYDIIHFHSVPDGNCLYVQFPVFLIARFSGKKIITHLHVGNQLEYPKYRNKIIFRWWLKKSSYVVLLANRFVELYKKYYIDIETPFSVIYNACDDVDAIPYEEHDKTIIFAGSFVTNKGGEHLLEAFGRICQQYPDWSIKMLGDGPNLIKYYEIIEKYKMHNRIELPGHVTGNTLKGYFRRAGIYAMCSDHEGFPMVVLESWAYGIPVICTPVGGLPDVIEEGKNAVCYNHGNIEQLISCLRKLMDNEQLRKEMSNYSIEFGKKVFGKEVINKKIDKLYSKILNG